jgi:hypothetical protein
LRSWLKYSQVLSRRAGSVWSKCLTAAMQADAASQPTLQVSGCKSKWRTFGALGGIKAAANRNGAPMQATHRCRTCSKTGTCKRSAILRPNRPNSCVPMATHRCVFPAKEPGAKPSVRSVRFDREKDLIPGMGAIFEQNLAHAQQRARVASPTDPPPPPLRVASPTDPPPPPPPQ